MEQYPFPVLLCASHYPSPCFLLSLFPPLKYYRVAICFQTARANLINLRMESASRNEFMSVSLLPNGSKVISQALLMRLSYVRESGNGLIPNLII